MSATSQNSIVPHSEAPDAVTPDVIDQPSPGQELLSPDAAQSQPVSQSDSKAPSKARQILLGVNVAIAAIVLGKSLLDPTVGQPRPFELPETVELNHWSLTNSEELEPFTLITGEADYSDEGQRYTYTLATNALSNELPNQDISATLTIEMRYMINTNGFIERLLMGHKDFQNTLAELREQGVDTSTIAADTHYQSGIGYSGRFQIEDTTYLSACINPRGESTFFIDQFHRNQSIYDRDPARLLPVLFGRQTWTDQRCFWTHMALSPNVSGGESSADTTEISTELQALLDDTWVEWHDLWQPQFPKR